MKILLLISVFLVTFPFPCLAQPWSPEEVLRDVAQSHIDGNIPIMADFDKFLKRDLERYFSKTLGKPVDVSYEFLRKGPTQTGISYPKFYLWAEIHGDDRLIDQGAVRLAAVEQIRFEVTDFLSKAEIQSTPSKVSKIFPQLLVSSIIEKVKK